MLERLDDLRPFDPDALRHTCREIVADNPFLSLDPAAAAAVRVPPDQRGLPPWDDAPFADVPDQRVTPWLLAYNAANFSYWPDAGPRWWIAVDGQEVGRDDEALALMAVMARQPVASPAWAKGMTKERLVAALSPAPGAGRLPLMSERAAALRELHAGYDRIGGPKRLVAEAEGSALRFVALLAALFPSWEDTRDWHGVEVRFMKRAQLCAAMIDARLGGAVFSDRERLTAFADYRLPQVLRALGVIQLDPRLALQIERGEPLARGSHAEIALRAAAVDGAERIAEANGLSAIVVDHFLWRAAVRLETRGEIPPFHRTRCTDY